AYQGDVQIDGDNGWQTVANNKSFFPDNWNGAELRRQLQSIDTNDPSQWFFDSGTRKFEATTPSGLRIAGFFDRNEGAYRPFPECC
ncbi:EndoU domain-containing protein, partial [Burkholderia pseudomallei]